MGWYIQMMLREDVVVWSSYTVQSTMPCPAIS